MSAYANDPRVLRAPENVFCVPAPGGHPRNPNPAWGVMYSKLRGAWVAIPPDAVGTPDVLARLPRFATADEAIRSLIEDPK